MFIAFFRIIKFAFQQFFRNFWLSFVTISIVTLTLLSVNLLIVINVLADFSIKQVQEKVDVSIFFKNDTSRELVIKTKDYLDQLPQVKETVFVPKEEGIKTIERFDIVKESLEELEENPLNDILRIKTKTIPDYEVVLKTLEDPQYASLIEQRDENFVSGQEYITKLNLISTRVKEAGLTFSAIFILVSILIVYYTIRVSIYSHREEIGVMRLVGAGNMFIKAPFWLVSLSYALLAFGISAVATFFAIQATQPHLVQFFGTHFSLLDFIVQNIWLYAGVEILAVSFLCVVSSNLAVGKYLKV